MENQNIAVVESIAKRLGPQTSCANKRFKLSDTEIIVSTSIGNVRERNEDRVVFALIQNQAINGTTLAVGAIADGMGGMKKGDEAASNTIAGFLTYLATGESERGLKDLCDRAIKYAHEFTINKLGHKCGSTLSAIVYGKHGCVGVNAGDSRIYSYDKLKGVEQITVDDTIAAQVRDNIWNDNYDDWSSPNRGDNRLIQHIGMEGDLEPHIETLSRMDSINDINSGYLLTSDGLHYVGKKVLNQIVKNSSSVSDLSKKLISIAEWLGGHDNLSLAVLPNSINLSDIGGDGKNTTIRIFSPDSEFEFILPKNCHLIENKVTSVHQQRNLFNESPMALKPIKKKIPEKLDVNTKKCTNKKKKAPTKISPKKTKKKTTSKKAATEKKTAYVSNGKNVEAKIDYINFDNESGENNEI